MANELYIPIGLIRDHAADMKIDSKEARADLKARIFQISAMYEKDGGGLIYWTRRDRTAVNGVFQNHLADRQTQKRMLADLAACDEVLLPLKDILKFTMKCESRARFLVKLSNFMQKLEDPAHLSLFDDCINTLKRWAHEGVPAEPKENDLFLVGCFECCMSGVPEKIPEDVHKDFVVDRLDKILKLSASVAGGARI